MTIIFNEKAAATDPNATPQWRYEAIEALASEGNTRKPKHRQVDPVLEKYASELRKTGAFTNEAARVATKIFRADDEYRAEIEARVLAEESVSSIAAHTKLPEQVIQEYEFLFFDVRRFSEAEDWLVRNTTGLKHQSEYRVNDVRLFWGRQALEGGTVVIDELITSFKANRQVTDKFSLAVYLKNTGSVPLEIQSFVAINIIPQSGNGELWLVDFGMEHAAIEKIMSPASKASAVQALQAHVIECGRLIASGKPLPLPPNWKRKKPKQPSASTMEQMYAEAKLFRESRKQVPSSVASGKAKAGKVKAPGTGQLVDVLK